MNNDRAQSAYRFRVEAAELARNREHPKHQANADEARYGAACYPMSFTKGLAHDKDTGLVANASDFKAFRTAVDNGFAEPFTTRVRVPETPTVPVTGRENPGRRKWEAPTAGTVFDLEGPDAQAVTMPPAPELCSDELTYEMAEVYELALLRDVPFYSFDQGGGPGSGSLNNAIDRLNALSYRIDGSQGRPRKTMGGALTRQTAFRGSSPGVETGPYLSQFLLIGNSVEQADRVPSDGFIAYGANSIDQRVVQAEVADDYMMTRDEWLLVQEGFDVGTGLGGQSFTGKRRFICTPRDLATYVHVDALYQAYLNACLLLLGQGAPFDPAFDLLSGMGAGVLESPSAQSYRDYNAGGFALWGGPHILSLVTEVATRALKAVRYQKFNVHSRLRPEALAGRLEYAREIERSHPSICGAFSKMRDQLSKTLEEVAAANEKHSNGGQPTVLLPMAFAEGSPMHPAYGAGHATVAGACVTMLKAFFDTSAIFVRMSERRGREIHEINAGFFNKAHLIRVLSDPKNSGLVIETGAYQATASTKEDNHLEFKATGRIGYEDGQLIYEGDCPLTLEGELNKLAANISIGRNMAGVHYFSDYFDSVRMGEEIAIGILEEQALGYSTDRFVMSLPTFDGNSVRIGRA